MIIYSKHFFSRKDRKLPKPSFFPFIILIMTMMMCMVFCFFPTIKSINVNAPKINNSVEKFENKTFTTININTDNTFLYQDNEISLENIDVFLSKQFPDYKKKDIDDVKIFIRADKNVSYDTIINVIQKLNTLGFVNISLVGK